MSLKTTVLLLLMVAVLIIVPLALNNGIDFEGTDDAAGDVIGEIDPNYEPWFEPVWEPPGDEIESLLFALQAAIGAGFICFYFGYKIGCKKAGAV